jgi:Helix-turn-helix domain
MGGGLNRSKQHFILERKDGVRRWSETMDQGFSRGFTAAEKTELWDRWQRGESLKAIGRAFGKPSSSIYFQVSPHGGIRPTPRRRSRLALTLSEREEISRGIAVRRSARSMAGLLGRSPSTVSREISRNGGYDGEEPAIVVRKVGSASHLPLQNDQLMSNYRILSLKSALRLECRDQHGQNEADQRYNCANSADSVT